MNGANEGHLTDDQFADLLIEGALSEPFRRHVAECASCQEELAEFTELVGMFNMASLNVCKSRQLPSVRVAARRQARRAVYAPLGLAFASALLVGVGVPAWRHSHPVYPGSDAAIAVVTEDSAAQIAEDNQLLQSVDVALTTNDGSPLPEYRLLEASRRPSRADSRTQ